MNSKKIFISIIVIVIVFAIIGFAVYKVYMSDFAKVIYNENKEDVDEGVKVMMEAEKYKKMSKNQQIDIMGELLKNYENNDVIKNLNYSKDEVLYSFEYNSGDDKGTLGGVSLKNWDEDLN